MFRKLLISVAALGLAAPVMAAPTLMVTFPSVQAIPGNNDFQTELSNIGGAGLGFTTFASLGADLILSDAATITFEIFGSESTFSDSFSAGALLFTETSNLLNLFGSPATPLPGTPTLIGSEAFSAGSLVGQLNFLTNNAGGANATVGQGGFGIFLRPGQVSGSSSTVYWFGYDDELNNFDDNHDDFVIRATVSAIPEPGTWAMMVGGVGIAGMALRRRRRTASAAVMA